MTRSFHRHFNMVLDKASRTRNCMPYLLDQLCLDEYGEPELGIWVAMFVMPIFTHNPTILISVYSLIAFGLILRATPWIKAWAIRLYAIVLELIYTPPQQEEFDIMNISSRFRRGRLGM